jgi:UDP-N-acetylmuramyl pentapeptide phosphotransferase/UDP-N-acetylglucosamine-1-phosphate transferase
MTSGLLLISAGAGTLLASALGVSLVRRLAHQSGLLDVPNERSLHQRPVPRGGGVAIVFFLATAIMLSPELRMNHGTDTVAGIVGCLLLIATVSFLDDLRPLSISLRLTVQILAAALVIAAMGSPSLTALSSGNSLISGWLAGLTAAVWIVAVTNAYNFMDGIDGLAGIQAAIAGMGWLLVSLMTDVPLTLVGVVIMAASIGFLLHNWSPASIFMGDVGSASLGFIFAVMTVLAASTEMRYAAVGVLLLWPFFFDTSLTLCRRLRRGEHVFTAHRSHLYQRLVISGRSHAVVAMIYGVLASVGVVCAAMIAARLPGSLIWSIIVVATAATALWQVVQNAERVAKSNQRLNREEISR